QKKVTRRYGNIESTCQHLTDTRSCYPRPNIHLITYYYTNTTHIIRHRIIRQVLGGWKPGIFAIDVNSADLTSRRLTTNNHGASNDDPVYFQRRFLWAKTGISVRVCVYVECSSLGSPVPWSLPVEAPKPYGYTSSIITHQTHAHGSNIPAANVVFSFRFQSPSPGRNQEVCNLQRWRRGWLVHSSCLRNRA
ncbi:hypothetical protein CTA2_10352, partial [Colletotrichum tanaceti]